MATTTETLTNNFADQLSLDSPVKQRAAAVHDFTTASPAASRPTSSHPRRMRPSAFNDEDDVVGDHFQSNSSRPKTSHVSGRRRWLPDDEPSRMEKKEDFVPQSPSLRPMTSIYR